MKEILVVGAGFAGSVAARILADSGYHVRIFERRNHLAGNAYDPIDKFGYRMHLFGPHIFHTNSADVFNFLSAFTSWRHYEHRVLGMNQIQNFPIPANAQTIEMFFPGNGERLVELALKKFEGRKEISISDLLNSEGDLYRLGQELYENIFKNYTEKQWGLNLEQLGPTVANRVPIRLNADDRYFTDTFQFMPAPSYSELFSNMLAHPKIQIELETSHSVKDDSKFYAIFYTGSVDELLDYSLGFLPYRSLKFEFELPSVHPFQKCAQVNFTGLDKEYTRITEFHHLTGEKISQIAREYPSDYKIGSNLPFYPIPLEANRKLHDRYMNAALKQFGKYIFIGRLASYRYFNMDQIVAQSIAKTKAFVLANSF